MTVIRALLQVYVLCLIGRAILSWFPRPRSNVMAGVSEFLFTITEPILAPVRRVIPPLGGLDISFLVVMIALQVIIGIV